MSGNLEEVVRELLSGEKISEFGLKKVCDNPFVTKDSVLEVYKLLKSYQCSDKTIASKVHLLGISPKRIERNYHILRIWGVSHEQIGSYADILGFFPKKLSERYSALRRLGLSRKEIADSIYLLCTPLKTVEAILKKREEKKRLRLNETQAKQAMLKKLLGYSDEQAVIYAGYLHMSSDKLRARYDHHIGLVRDDYKSRPSGRSFLAKYVMLLDIPPETLEASVQQLDTMQIMQIASKVLSNNPTTRREKLAWVLRELFDYRTLPPKEKKEALRCTLNFVRDCVILRYPLDQIKTEKDSWREKAAAYKPQPSTK